MVNVLKLPEEVLLTILHFLTGRDILAFASTSRLARKFYEASSRLQYIVELEASSCIDTSLDSPLSNEADHTSVSEKLDYLRTREANWRGLDLFRNARKLPLDTPKDVSIYDLSSGVFAFGEMNREGLLNYMDLREVSRRGANEPAPVLPVTNGDDASPPYHWLAPISLPPSEVPWETFSFDGSVADFGLALKEHDLVALVSYNEKDNSGGLGIQEIKINLYEFSTRRPHPRANMPVIKLAEKPLTYRRPSPAIEIAGKYTVVLLTFPRAVIDGTIEDMIIINWHTGVIVHREMFDPPRYCSLAFVTPSLVVFPNLVENSLDLTHIFSGPDGTEYMLWARRLLLPELTSDFKLHATVCRADPNPTEDTPDPLTPDWPIEGKTRETRDKPSRNGRRWGASGYGIAADPLLAIISFKFLFVHVHMGMLAEPAMNLVVHRSTLVSLVADGIDNLRQTLLRNLPRRDSATIFHLTKWEDWGPPATRWRFEDGFIEWVTTTAGQRQVYTSISPEVPWRPLIIIRDYNPYEVGRMKAKARLARESGNNKDVKIHVDSVDGLKHTDSEDENEDGQGEDAWIIESDDGNGPGIDGELQAATDANPVAIGQGDVQTQQLVNEENGNVEDGPNAPGNVTPAGQWTFAQQFANWPLATPQNPEGNALPPIPTFTFTLDAPSHSAPPDSDELSTRSESTYSLTVPSPSSDDSAVAISDYKNVSIRVRDTIVAPSARYFKKGEVRGGLPCVEYAVDGNERLYSGLLIDDERIIGYMETDDNPGQTERMADMSVFSMYP